MGPVTFVPLWIVQDIVLLASGVAIAVWIVARARHRISAFLEIAAFTFLYAGVYENISSVIGWYQWGSSLVMLFNVPLAVALYEAVVCYAALELLARFRMPAWLRPIGAGFLAVVQDFALDTVATHLYADTEEGGTAHWTFHIPLNGVEIYGEPVMNFASWMWLVGVAAVFTVIGRWWHRRSGYQRSVEIAYPLVATVASLLVLFSPLSRLVLFGEIGYSSGEWTDWPSQHAIQWWILAAMLIVPPILFAVLWRGRFLEPLDIRQDKAIVYALVGVPILNVAIGVAGGLWEILWLAALAAAAMAVMVLGAYWIGSRQNAILVVPEPRASARAAAAPSRVE